MKRHFSQLHDANAFNWEEKGKGNPRVHITKIQFVFSKHLYISNLVRLLDSHKSLGAFVRTLSLYSSPDLQTPGSKWTAMFQKYDFVGCHKLSWTFTWVPRSTQNFINPTSQNTALIRAPCDVWVSTSCSVFSVHIWKKTKNRNSRARTFL